MQYIKLNLHNTEKPLLAVSLRMKWGVAREVSFQNWKFWEDTCKGIEGIIIIIFL